MTAFHQKVAVAFLMQPPAELSWSFVVTAFHQKVAVAFLMQPPAEVSGDFVMTGPGKQGLIN